MTEEKQVTRAMLADIQWLHQQLRVMGAGFNKYTTAEHVGRSIEFVKGVLWEREHSSEVKRLKEEIAMTDELILRLEAMRDKV